MRLSSIVPVAAAFLVAAVLSLVAAGYAVSAVEQGSKSVVRQELVRRGMEWVTVDTNGLQVFLAGTAPSEAARFNALSAAGSVVDAARLIDQMLVAEAEDIAPPRFSVEILRNESGVSLIGLIPGNTDRAALTGRIAEAAPDEEITDLLETADYARPDTWSDTLDFAIRALAELERAKISADADRVKVTAMTESRRAKREMEETLSRLAPAEVGLALDISAPRPVITPFTLRFLIEDGKARFDACSADTEAARERILAAARAAGMEEDGENACTVGLGVPSPKWATAVEQAISALSDLGGGSVTFSDADISLLAQRGTPQERFDSVVGRLENELPEVFALHAVLPETPDEEEAGGAPEFTATLSPEGLVQLRGRLPGARSRRAVESLSKARFSADSVHNTVRVDEDLPSDWPLRVMAGIEALSHLSNGAVTITPDSLRIAGDTGQKDARARIAGFLSDKLGEGAQFSIDVTYEEQLDPVASKPTPEECESRIKAAQEDSKISFEPGSAKIGGDGKKVMNEIAEILKECGEIRMEIGGHTDSQGREVMNQQLSQARAQAVLNALRARRVLTSSFTAKGYGESQPIADNDTEEGREANRRIEFRLIRPESVAEADDSDTGKPGKEEAAADAAEPADGTAQTGDGATDANQDGAADAEQEDNTDEQD
ncbi:OmpA family protein [Roseovarius salinarum]|uniref:OmpA family protein n=1 Tax=Roseovarius salinarum TaxID=1981892 RepID=UPI000C325F85|nr:OmpA family protein [Roseovarius salinarum]